MVSTVSFEFATSGYRKVRNWRPSHEETGLNWPKFGRLLNLASAAFGDRLQQHFEAAVKTTSGF